MFLESGKQLPISKNLLPNSRNQLPSVTQQGESKPNLYQTLKFRYTAKEICRQTVETSYPTQEFSYPLPNSGNQLPIPEIGYQIKILKSVTQL